MNSRTMQIRSNKANLVKRQGGVFVGYARSPNRKCVLLAKVGEEGAQHLVAFRSQGRGVGVRVWLPLPPADRCHPNVLSRGNEQGLDVGCHSGNGVIVLGDCCTAVPEHCEQRVEKRQVVCNRCLVQLPDPDALRREGVPPIIGGDAGPPILEAAVTAVTDFEVCPCDFLVEREDSHQDVSKHPDRRCGTRVVLAISAWDEADLDACAKGTDDEVEGV